MLSLSLRSEFNNRRLKGTAIEFSNQRQTGATQLETMKFLEITYPTYDLLRAIETLGSNSGQPVVVIGERGLGKSHLMATLYHAISDKPATTKWLELWSVALKRPDLLSIFNCKDMHVIGESLHRQKYTNLWDILFDRHPSGRTAKDEWEKKGSAKTSVPPYDLILNMLQKRPLLLLLDEFQTWYDGITNTKQLPRKAWAFNFIQILTEIAKEYPELLTLVVSIRNGETDAYQQVHRLNPIYLDFKSSGNINRVEKDRRQMLLHRLFENRSQIDQTDILATLKVHISEYCRLKNISKHEIDEIEEDFLSSWPFSPSLLRLLEDQVLVATDAQETRDLIRILANLYKNVDKNTKIITAAAINLEDDSTGVGALLDSVANEHHRKLRDKARRNLTSIRETSNLNDFTRPNSEKILGALWLRSITIERFAGASKTDLQIDITNDVPNDDNTFELELTNILENSFNIHYENGLYRFKESDNPQAKLLAYSRNEKLFEDERDKTFLSEQIKKALQNPHSISENKDQLVVMPWNWQKIEIDEKLENNNLLSQDHELTFVVIPEYPTNLQEVMGNWVKEKISKNRNSFVFILPRDECGNIFFEPSIKILNRLTLLSSEWKNEVVDYRKLEERYRRELRKKILESFCLFVMLKTWNYDHPERSTFHLESVTTNENNITESIKETILRDLYVSEEVNEFFIDAARENLSLKNVMKELKEPRIGQLECIPWVGLEETKKQIARLCGEGLISINFREIDFIQRGIEDRNEDVTELVLKKIMSIKGRYLDEIILMTPAVSPTTEVTIEKNKRKHQHQNDVVDSKANPNRDTERENSKTSPKWLCSRESVSVLDAVSMLEEWGIGNSTIVLEFNLNVVNVRGKELMEAIKKISDESKIKISLQVEHSGDLS